MSTPSTLTPPIRFQPQYSIDVLSDGSEMTGFPSIFLSVFSNELCDDDSLRARYAISGLGDLVSRLAADQRFKLAPTRAVFCPTEESQLGLPSLQIALHQAGAPTLSIIPNDIETVEKVIDLLESRRQHPQIQLCNVPDEASWWKVHWDEFLVTYAYRHESCIMFLYCLLPEGTRGILLVPPGVTDKATAMLQAKDVPCIDDKPVHVELVLSLEKAMKSPDPRTRVYCVNSYTDSGRYLLMHAREAAVVNHYRACNDHHWADPKHFPMFYCVHLSQSYEGILPSGWSLRMQHEYVKVARCEGLRNAVKVSTAQLEDLREFLESTPAISIVHDENEIDLEDGESRGVEKPEVFPMLHVLGTGCAAPSPHRGASAHVLALSNSVSIAFEVGEGFVTQWEWHVTPQKLGTIRLIWVSHAHWDHYGGLLHLLHSIKVERKIPPDSHDKASDNQSGGGAKKSCRELPFVVAPPKVLAYLAAATGEQSEQLCRAVSLTDDRQLSVALDYVNAASDAATIFRWQNVPVHHSCRDSYGFVASISAQERIVNLAFSGDTTRCRAFDEALRRLGTIDLLIHEATFNDKDAAMAITKKHSTVSDALVVARECKAKRVLLTHFSQRYGLAMTAESGPSTEGLVVGYAVDGLAFTI